MDTIAEKIEVGALDVSQAEIYADLLNREKLGFCYECGALFDSWYSHRCGHCGGSVCAAPSSGLVLECLGKSWAERVFKCGPCVYGITHEAPYKCILGVDDPRGCEGKRVNLAEMHVNGGYEGDHERGD